ncbi:MAG: hypothetical protein Q7W30_06025 [Coriobacteriia bacterium]|nr:hypothetical protein [Coriobacteriia bacterium]
MSGRDDDTRVADDGSAPAPARRLHFPIKSVIALAIIVIVGLPVFSLLQPGYYRRYADLGPRMDNWSQSTHAKVPCSGCHVEPGVSGFLTFAAKSIPAFYSQLLHGPRPANLFGVPGRAACQECHTGYRQVSPNGDLLIPHRAHVEVLKLDCAVCHKDLVHVRNTLGYNKPSMSACLSACHNGKSATDKCVKCHTRKQVPDNHRRKDWLEVHSTLARTIDCGSCHAWSPDFCRECHLKRPASHAGNWKKLHGAVAKAGGDKGCLVCHEGGKSCRKCHD